ncbi:MULTISPECIES: 1-deoxy-D-xylulose-5-phosphate synthase [unclassified Oceanispirochaeta]|uniref:1-deoxy-D-xylulose-5-phosphate synthase n=1 Tax=unclassified Oceanispirochaeta TaxID=2635722 RepID=UPI000E093024|nr:1-deoxy-D-xylulose-5-phosphate synthase [Oceanispirochaeta sp. M1]MBF9016851.1 1-deoxy-D-xylulose-5-phosphate synthase [Oceanispirochaeta sp. M2]NPD73214.1 1-deoxy-D-xylulose-5-phosphate synthase [Oceanispirochaeta sp. M1]RDG31081.1 1-deoxy-D-xylulose-5-phosphate synthase [Oceanispirochaeta sp. M1]
MNKYPILSGINHPDQLKSLSMKQLKELAAEIRTFIIQTVSQNGGHLASNLGVVELTLAMHRVYISPRDKFIWDVGHQCYTHKLLTGRFDQFHTIRKEGGLSGFPKREESPHDIFNTGHASTSISAGIGVLIGDRLQEKQSKVLCVIGDGALTGGQALEALNFTGHIKNDLVVILNDNEMSIGKNVGAISSYMSRLALTGGYKRFRNVVDFTISHIPFFGKALLRSVYRLKRGVKGVVYKENLFTDLGFKYVGPVNGHNLEKLTDVLQHVRDIEGPVLLHVLTTKGKGYSPAEGDPSSYHGVGPFAIETGKVDPSLKTDPDQVTTTAAFGCAVMTEAEKNGNVVAVSAAMASGTGLMPFKEKYPHRFFDVGIAEAHALTFAAGQAAAGLRPVVAIYSTFMQRSVDQLIHDIALPGLPVVICMDRAGLVGDDGETHQGIFDIIMFRNVPGISFLAPLSVREIEMAMEWACASDKPVLIRYPKGVSYCSGEKQDTPLVEGKGVLVSVREKSSVLLISLGGLLEEVVAASDILEEKNISCDVYHMRFIRPLDRKSLIDLMSRYEQILFVEEGLAAGGMGEEIASMLRDESLDVLYTAMGVPSEFLSQATRKQLIKRCGLDRKSIAAKVEDVQSELRFSKVVDMVKNDKWSPHNI